MIAFPNISPEIVTVPLFGFDLAIRWYALSYLVGFYLAFLNMRVMVRRPKLWNYALPPVDKNQIETLVLSLAFGAILGGRLGYVLFYDLHTFASDPFRIVRLWEGGMSFHGGLLGAIVALLGFCRLQGVLIWGAADLVAVSAPLGLFLGRIANFINAELWGAPTNLPWGVIFPGEEAQNCAQVIGPCARHPTQLYEALLEGAVLFLVLWSLALLGGLKKPKLLTGIFLIGYGLSRYFVEFLRVADPQFLSAANPEGYVYYVGDIGIKMGQILSLPMIIAGAILVISALALKQSKGR